MGNTHEKCNKLGMTIAQYWRNLVRIDSSSTKMDAHYSEQEQETTPIPAPYTIQVNSTFESIN
jgi:hypothetical protein